MTPGRVFAVVGPSGAGKDTLMEAAAAADPSLHLVRRVITRPEAAGGERFEGISREQFAARRAAGDFAIWWEAHGLYYGIPKSIHQELAAGRTVLFNGSRAALPAARQAFPDLRVILVKAPPEVLAARLAKRGRETASDITARLARAGYDLPAELHFETIVNDGSVAEGAARLLAALQPERALR